MLAQTPGKEVVEGNEAARDVAVNNGVVKSIERSVFVHGRPYYCMVILPGRNARRSGYAVAIRQHLKIRHRTK